MPTEGKVATTSVEVDIPPGVMVDSVEPADGVKSDMKREGGRVVSITWTVTIEPGANREFTFTAKNPSDATEIVWKAHQRYADGTSSEWVGAAGTRHAVTAPRLAASRLLSTRRGWRADSAGHRASMPPASRRTPG